LDTPQTGEFTTRYRYADGFYDRSNRKFTGFAQVISEGVDPVASTVLRKTCSVYKNRDFVSAGLLERTTVSEASTPDADACAQTSTPVGRFQETILTYHPPRQDLQVDRTALACPMPAPLLETACDSTFIGLNETVERRFSNGLAMSHAQRIKLYDDFGNPREVEDDGDSGVPGGGLNAVIDYANVGPEYLAALPATITVYESGNTDPRRDVPGGRPVAHALGGRRNPDDHHQLHGV